MYTKPTMISRLFACNRILTAYSSNHSFRFFLETDLHTAEKHFGANLKLSVTLIVTAFSVTHVHIFKPDLSFDIINTGRIHYPKSCFGYT